MTMIGNMFESLLAKLREDGARVEVSRGSDSLGRPTIILDAVAADGREFRVEDLAVSRVAAAERLIVMMSDRTA